MNRLAKKFKLFLLFYSGNVIPVLAIIVVLTISTFFMIQTLGKIQYIYYSKDLYIEADMQNYLYYMPGFTDVMAENKEILAEKNEVLSNNANSIEDIILLQITSIGYGDGDANIRICDESYINAFNPVDQGEWLSADEKNGPIEIVVSGYYFDNVKVGSEIELIKYKDEHSVDSVMAKVIGKVNEPALTLEYTMSSPTISASDLYIQVNNLIYANTQDTARIFQVENLADINRGIYSNNFLIRLKDDISQNEKNELYSFLSDRGSFVTYEEIMAETDVSNSLKAKEILPYPLFLMLVSTVSLLAICILLINKKIADHSIYFLCGCSKKRSFAYMFMSLLPLGAVSGIINGAFVLLQSSLYKAYVLYYLWPAQDVIMNNNTLLFILIYTVVAIFISVGLAFLTIKNKSLIDIYKGKQL